MATPILSASVKEKRAREALIYFHNQALKYPQNYSGTLDELIQKLQGRSPSFMVNFGGAAASVSEAQIQTAMKDLADQGEGRLPKYLTDWFDVINGQITKVAFMDAVKGGLAQTVQDLGEVGKAGLTGVKWSLYSLPIILLVGVGIFAFVKSGGNFKKGGA